MSSNRIKENHTERLWRLRMVFGMPVLLLLVSVQPLAQRTENMQESRRFYPDDPLWEDNDMMHVPSVKVFELEKQYDFLENTFLAPDLPYGTEALNTNTLGEVPDSAWWTNRIGVREMSITEIVRGPDTVDGPAPGKWTIIGRPEGGITPKFTIKDARGDTYIFKLDPPHMLELPSSAEMVSTKIFHALGFNVAQDFLVWVKPEDLEIKPGATWKDAKGKRREIDREDVDYWFQEYVGRTNGQVRVLASKFIPGKPVGEYKHYGTRPDDPNDVIPHERRRELRAMRVFAAWLNHDDSRALNTFDTFYEEDGRTFIKHFLLDFGSNLGSGSTNFQEPRAGNEYYWQPGQIIRGIASLGIYQRGWMKVRYQEYPSIGRYESDFFDPAKWKPEYPNPAFDRMDAADAFWGAKLVSNFTDEMIDAIVSTARLSDPKAEAYLIETIKKRRDKCVHWWISRTNPLDEFKIGTSSNPGPTLTFENAAIRTGAASPKAAYAVTWYRLDNLGNQEEAVGEQLRLAGPEAAIPEGSWGPEDDAGYRYSVARISSFHPDFPNWQEPVVVSLRRRGEKLEIVGIERPRKTPTYARR